MFALVFMLASVIWYIYGTYVYLFKGNQWYYTLINVSCWVSGYGKVQYQLACNVAKFESGNFSSSLFKSNKNMFGMKHPTIRPTKSTGSTNGFATFSNYCNSALDFFLWCKNAGMTKSMTYDQCFELMVSRKYMGDDPNVITSYRTFMMSADKESEPVVKWLVMVFVPMVITIILIVIAMRNVKLKWLNPFAYFNKKGGKY